MADTEAEPVELRAEVARLSSVVAKLAAAVSASLNAGPDAEAVSKLELAALRAVATAARRTRMLKGGADSVHQLGRALETLDEVLGDARGG